jgi:hypothetical protein
LRHTTAPGIVERRSIDQGIFLNVSAQSLAHLTPAQKLAVAQRLRQTAWELVRAGVRMREPALSDEAVEERVRQIFRRATS